VELPLLGDNPARTLRIAAMDIPVDVLQQKGLPAHSGHSLLLTEVDARQALNYDAAADVTKTLQPHEYLAAADRGATAAFLQSRSTPLRDNGLISRTGGFGMGPFLPSASLPGMTRQLNARQLV
jgi:hypothetical protein